jgi:hypothetical protein
MSVTTHKLIRHKGHKGSTPLNVETCITTQITKQLSHIDMGMPYRVLNIVIPSTKPMKKYKKSHEEIQMKPKISRLRFGFSGE